MNDKPYFSKMAILGVGLLGGSIAKTAKKNGMVSRVSGHGRNPQRISYAIKNGIIDEAAESPEEAVGGADLVIVCTPVGLISETIERISGRLEPGAIVTDVGSTKATIVKNAEAVLPDSVSFVGGHPMAGSEESGVEASTDTLFENALCVLTSSDRTNISALNRMARFWEAMRSQAMIMSPEEHDLLVAASSHLPHMVAVALTRCVAGISTDREKVLPLLAGGFRDTTRIASGSADMWRDICLTNPEFIGAVMEKFARTMTEVAEAVRGCEPERLERLFADAKNFRDGLPAKGRGILAPASEILVDVSDRPGVIGEITLALGEAGINIRNINVQHVREMRGGTLSLILEKASDMESAAKILSDKGFTTTRVD
jgi:prephenate dehydrogenase